MNSRRMVGWVGLLLLGTGLAYLYLTLVDGSARRHPAPAVTPGKSTASANTNFQGTQQPPDPTFARFAEWARDYSNATDQERSRLESAGIEIATQRRSELKQLIQRDPQRALELTVPSAIRRQLPQTIHALLEERVSGRGELALLAAVPAPGREREVKPNFRTATIGDKTYEAFVYGRRADHLTMRNVALNGIAIDGLMAVHTDPVRVLDPDEAASMLKKKIVSEAFCIVSGEAALSKDSPTVVEVAGEELVLCSPDHVAPLSDRIVQAEGLENPVGAAGEGPLPSPYTEGIKRLIFIRVDFSDLPGGSFTDAQGLALITNCANYWAEASYHKTTVTLPGAGSDLTPVFRMPDTAANYGNNNRYAQLRTDARAAATAAGYVLSDYEFDIICIGQVPGFSWGGLGYVGGPGSWIRNTSSTGTTVHELGHNLGLNHASFWDTSGQSVIGPGTRIEYGDNFDTMGSGGSTRHYNARYRAYLNWLAPSDVLTLSSNGVYRLNAYDVTNSVGIRAMRIFKTGSSATNTYWLEFRQRSANTRWATNGVSLRWAGSGNQRSQLLDTTPGSSSGKDDSALVIGRTFSDYDTGIHITVLGKGGTSPESMDIAYNRGTFPANLPPTITITGSASNAAAGAQLTFTASASDPDSDALAYYWDFGNGDFGTNNSSVRYAFTTVGEYVVRCTASDMKGGVASDSLIVRIGAPATFRISGRVTRADGTPIEGVRIFASSTRVTYTDTDGYYNLVGVLSGSYTINAAREEFSFTHPGFSNPVRVGPSHAVNIDFIGTAPTGETLLALVAAGAEWKFLDNGSNQGTAWTNNAFNDLTWNEGPAQLGYGDDDEATTVSFGPSSASKYITTYFRHAFYIEDPTDFATLTLGLLRDDAAIIYLNGREIVRDNIAATGVNYLTRALAAVDSANESTFFETGVDPTFLRAGTNVLAVELHQNSSTSSDISFDLYLNALAVTNLPRGVFITSPAQNTTVVGPTNILFSANASAGPTGSITRVEFYARVATPLATETLLGEDTSLPYTVVWSNAQVGVYSLTARAYDDSGIILTSTPANLTISAILLARGSVWKYRDVGVDLGSAWIARDFNDAVWASGRARLGYGGDGEITTVGFGSIATSKYITTYFRRWFNAPTNLSLTQLAFRLQRDDGAVVYLNGNEAFRHNMPDTPLTFGTLASTRVDAADETTFFEVQVPSVTLEPGTNLVAVEVHQATADSSDLGFDLELLGSGSAALAAPALTITHMGLQAQISWSTIPGWTLYSCTTFDDWAPASDSVTQVGGQSVVMVTPGSTTRFFQLRRE